MSSSSQTAPFVSFPVGTALSATIEVGSGPNLNFLGQSESNGRSRDLYLNRDFDSLGLVCGSSTEDIETIVRRLVAAHTSDLDAQVLILYSQKFVGKRKACSLLNSTAQTIFISPRNLESSTKLYASAGINTSPLNFRESALTTQHLLEFFTPPADMQGRNMILSTIQLIISQLPEPFDLQYFIEMIEKENWTEDAASFMALRQTILTSLLSSPQSKQPEASPSFGDGAILDLGDPILRHAGLENVMMDMLLHQFLLDCFGGRRLLVLYNSHEYLSMGSPLSSSLESLATSGSNRTTSVILATTSPSSVPLEYYNSVDYVVYSSGRSSVWNNTLREHFCLEPPTTHRMPGRFIIWSPDSIHIETDFTEDLAGGAEVQADGHILITLSELKRTMPQSYEQPGSIWVDSAAGDISEADAYSLASNTAPVSDMPSASSPLNDEEEGMITLSSIYMDNLKREGSPTPVLQNEAEAAETSSVRHTAEALKSPIFTANLLPSATTSRSATLPSTPPSAYLPLILAVLRVSDQRLDALVSFEVVRSVLGDQAAIEKLGWSTYISYVDDARRLKLLDVIETSGGFKFIRLLPSGLLQNVPSVKTPPVIKTKPLVRPPPSKQAPSTSKLKPQSIPAIPTKVQAPTTSKATLPPITQICPAKYLPLVKAIIKLGRNNIQAKVSFNAVGLIVGNTKEELQARGYQWASYAHWVQKAHEESWILQGGYGGWRWVMLGSKMTEGS